MMINKIRSRNYVDILLRSGALAKFSNCDGRTLNITNCETDHEKRSLLDKHNFEQLRNIHSSVPRRTWNLNEFRGYINAGKYPDLLC